MPLDEELVVELLEEPEVTWGDKWRNFKQKIFSSFQYSAIIFSYVPFILWFLLVGPSRVDPIAAFIVDLFPFIGFGLLGGSIIVTSSQTFLLNQIKGAGKDVIEAELIYPNHDYGMTISNVIMYYLNLKDESELFQIIIQDYNRRKRVIKFGSEFDEELKFKDGTEKYHVIDTTDILEEDEKGEISRKDIEKSNSKLSQFKKFFGKSYWRKEKKTEEIEEHEEINDDEEVDESDQESDGEIDKSDEPDSYVVYTTAGQPILVTEASDPELFERIKKQETDEDDDEPDIQAYDFRTYLENFPLFTPPLLESGLWNILLLKFKIGYWVGNSYTKAMFILSPEDSLDKLFPSTHRYIELEGIIGESIVYHTILVLVGFWRNIPICVPMHTRKKIDLILDYGQRMSQLEPHKHEFDSKTALCTVKVNNKEGGESICGRSLVSLVNRWYYSETAPTEEEIVGTQNRIEMAMLKHYFTAARDYEIKMQEQSVLMNDLLDRGTGMNEELMEIDTMLADQRDKAVEKIPTVLLVITALIVGYAIGFLRLIRIG